MSPAPDYALLLLNHLSDLRRFVQRSCRSRAIGHEVEDVVSALCVKLLEADGAVIRAHQGRGPFRAYLARIVDRFVLDYQNREWGKWRPSVQALRLGPAGLLLDQLMSRDQLPTHIAVSIVSHRLRMAEADVNRMAAALSLTKRCGRRQPNPVESEPTVMFDGEGHEYPQLARSLQQALCAAVNRLDAVERLMLERRFRDNKTVTDVASELGIERKRLYRHYEQTFAKLRRHLLALGFDGGTFAALLATGAYTIDNAFVPAVGRNQASHLAA
jgi:RNA polymerase sigma factor (sigma-70 family)